MPFDLLIVALSLPALARKLLEKLAARDPDLARQCRRAITSVPLNVAEGRQRAGRDRAHHYRVSLGSAAEVDAVVEIAIGLGYVDRPECTALLAALDRVRAMAWRVSR